MPGPAEHKRGCNTTHCPGEPADRRASRGQAHLSTLLGRIAALGYEPYPFTDDETERATIRERRSALRRLIIAGLGMSEIMSYATAMYAGALQDMTPAIQEFLRLTSLLVATPVVFYSGAPFFAGAWRRLRNRRPGMDLRQ